MRQKILSLFTAGLLISGLCVPASAAHLGNLKPEFESNNQLVNTDSNYVPDEAGTVSFENIDARMRANNLNILSLQATLDSQLAFNREKAYNNFVDTINAIAEKNPTSAMDSTIQSMREQLKELQADNYEEVIELLSLQIENLMEQMVVAAEGMYINIATMEATRNDLQRTIDMLDRNMTELELRHQLGQISKLTLEQFKATYDATLTQVSTLENTISLMKSSLEYMLGETPSGEIRLAAIPNLTQTQTAILAMDYEDALTHAKEGSFTLYQADKDLKDAEDEWKDAKKDNSINSYPYRMAEQTYQSAVLSHQSAIKSFELSFYSIYQGISTAQLALDAANIDYNYQQESFQATKVSFDLGLISYNALISAEEDVLAAQSAVEAAQLSLFSAYMDYFWAVEYGMVQ